MRTLRARELDHWSPDEISINCAFQLDIKLHDALRDFKILVRVGLLLSTDVPLQLKWDRNSEPPRPLTHIPSSWRILN